MKNIYYLRKYQLPMIEKNVIRRFDCNFARCSLYFVSISRFIPILKIIKLKKLNKIKLLSLNK